MEYPTAYTVVLDNPYFKLLCCKPANEHPSTLLLGAIAGHKTQFSIDYATGKSVAGSALQHCKGGVYILHIKPPSLFSRFVVTYDTWLSQVKESVEFIDTGAVRLVGVCQGGAMAAKFATLYPELVCELVIAAAPINTSTPSALSPAQKFPYVTYYAAVMAHGWIMPGKVMLDAWMAHDPERHEEAMKDPRSDYFYARYFEVQDIDPYPYLWMIHNVFLTLNFFNSLHIICPVHTIVGKEDEITPQAQVEAIEEKCTLPITKHYVEGGHMATFGGSEAMKEGGPYATIFGGE